MPMWKLQVDLAGLLLLAICVLLKGRLVAVVCRKLASGNTGGFLRHIAYYVPIVNTYLIERAIYRKASLFGWMMILLVMLAAASFAGDRVFPATEFPGWAKPYGTNIMSGVAIVVVLYVVELLLNWDLCKMLDRRRWLVWAIVLPPLCSLLLAERMVAYSRKMSFIWESPKEEEPR